MIGIYFLVFFDFLLLASSLLLYARISYYRSIEQNEMKLRTSYSAEDAIIPLLLLAFSALTFYIGVALTSYGNIAFYAGVRTARDSMQGEMQQLMNNIIQVNQSFSAVQDAWVVLRGTAINAVMPTLENWTNNMMPYAYLVQNHTQLILNPAYSFEVGRFSWVWIQMGIFIFIIICALVGYMPCKFCGLVIAASLIVIILFGEISALLAYTSSELLVIADLCQQLHGIVLNNTVPYGQTGIGYFLVPLAPVITI